MINYIEILKLNSVQNEYLEEYIKLCVNAQQRYNWDEFKSKNHNKKSLKNKLSGYYEVHHILPISYGLGGINDHNNYCYLTFDEHFYAHLLLTKFSIGKLYYKMLFALGNFSRASSSQNRSTISDENNELCSLSKAEATSNFHKGLSKPKSDEHRKKLSNSLKQFYTQTPKSKRKTKRDDPNYVNPNKGKKGHLMSQELKQKLININTGKVRTKESRDKQSASLKGHSGHNNKKWKITDIINNIEYFPNSLREFIRDKQLDDGIYAAHRMCFIYKKQWKVEQL